MRCVLEARQSSESATRSAWKRTWDSDTSQEALELENNLVEGIPLPREIMAVEEQEEAIVAAEAAAKQHPTDYERLNQLGWAYFDARRYDDAMVTFRRAIALYPNDARGYYGIGRAYLDNGQAKESLDALQYAIALDPVFTEPYVSLGIVYFWRLGDNEAALDAFQHALALDPEHPFALAGLAPCGPRPGTYQGRSALPGIDREIELPLTGS